jgi:hypothetical protein
MIASALAHDDEPELLIREIVDGLFTLAALTLEVRGGDLVGEPKKMWHCETIVSCLLNLRTVTFHKVFLSSVFK